MHNLLCYCVHTIKGNYINSIYSWGAQIFPSAWIKFFPVHDLMDKYTLHL